MDFEESFGIIPIKSYKNSFQTFLVQLKSGKHFGFPKGHANSLELPLDAAIRELKEETNLNVIKILLEKPLMEEYQIKKNSTFTSKKVYYYIAEVNGKVNIDKNKILDGFWVDIEKAKDIITYTTSKEIAQKVIDFLNIK